RPNPEGWRETSSSLRGRFARSRPHSPTATAKFRSRARRPGRPRSAESAHSLDFSLFFTRGWRRDVDRQADIEPGPFARPAIDRDRAAVTGDDAVNHRQAQPRPLVHRLGRKERLEGAAAGLFAHAATVIDH